MLRFLADFISKTIRLQINFLTFNFRLDHGPGKSIGVCLPLKRVTVESLSHGNSKRTKSWRDLCEHVLSHY